MTCLVRARVVVVLTGRVGTQLMLLQHSNDLLFAELARFKSQTPVQPGLVRSGNVTTTK